MSISLAGINSFQIGTTGEVVQYVVKETGTLPLSGFGTDYSSALNPDGSYKTTDTGLRFKAFEDIMRLTHDNLHEEEYNRIVARARATEGTIGAALSLTRQQIQIIRVHDVRPVREALLLFDACGGIDGQPGRL